MVVSKRLLYIDPFSELGHLNLNRVYIRTLQERGFDVRLVVRAGYAKELGLGEDMVEMFIPERFLSHGAGRWTARLNLWKTFRHIKNHLDLSAYAIVFFSAYDEISLQLAGIRRQIHLVDHANVSGLDNPLKRFFARRLAARATHIVLAGFIRDRLTRFGFDRVLVEPLGFTAPYEIDAGNREALLRSVHAKLLDGGFDHILFSPSGSKYGSPLIADTIANPAFLEYLEKNRILLVVKDKSLRSGHGNVLVLNEVLTVPQYRALFLRSDLIMICYPVSFNYRVSASMFESFSNGKPCLLTDIEGFRYYAPHFTYDPYFRDFDSLIKALDAWLAGKDRIAAEPFRGLESLVPTFRELLPPGRGAGA